MRPFDYRTATEAEILDLASELPGLTLGQLPGARFEALDGTRGKGEAGAAIEAYFGIPPNSRAEADFPGAGIELKAVPLVTGTGGLRVKERTVISMIDYAAIAREDWGSAAVRKKLAILFVFFEHLPGRPKGDFPISHVTLWRPSGSVEEQIRLDWSKVRDKVLAGLANELSESDGRILGPCTKGADSTVLRDQPFSTIRAKSRAFALKPTFTFNLYRDTLDQLVNTDTLAELSTLSELRRRFRPFERRTIADVGHEIGVAPSTAKDYAARVVHGAVRIASTVEAEELEKTLTVRVPHVGPDSMPYEAISFPAFRHHELIEEDWQDSDLLSRIEHMLIVPVYGASRSTPQADCTIGTPVYWEPTAAQLSTIEVEWTRFRDLIREGKAADLPSGSKTTAIHIRPHGRNAKDRDATPGGGNQTKKGFWLNKPFVKAILQDR